MREIKFRAWDKRARGWLKSYHIVYPFRWEEGKIVFNGDELDIIELLQYTGLKDKNGKESYWDDIVSDGINPPFTITSDYHLLARLSEIEFEVIGNIYENPELLEVKQ